MDQTSDAAPDPGPSEQVELKQEKISKPNSETTAETKEKDQPKEKLIYEGGISLWIGWKSFAGAALATLLGLTLLIAGWYTGNGWLSIYFGLPILIASLVMIGYVYLAIRCLSYKITDKFIERSSGILIKRTDTLDLARVKDVQMVRSIPQRMLKVGTIEIYSSDKTDPSLYIEDLPNPQPIYEALRDAVLQITQRRGIVSMDR